jgi:hypothetical protein
MKAKYINPYTDFGFKKIGSGKVETVYLRTPLGKISSKAVITVVRTPLPAFYRPPQLYHISLFFITTQENIRRRSLQTLADLFPQRHPAREARITEINNFDPIMHTQ